MKSLRIERRGWRAVLVAALLLGTIAGPADAQTKKGERRFFTLTGARVLLPDGTLVARDLVVSGDRIENLAEPGRAGLPSPVSLPETAVIAPGLVDVWSTAGAFGQNVERVQAIDPALRARDAIDPLHPHLRQALEHGITTVLVSPAPNNVVSGRGVVFRTHAPNGRLDVLREEGPLVFSIGGQVLRPDREPTSRSGAVGLLEEALALGSRGRGSTEIRGFLEGRIDGLLVCDDQRDVRRCLQIFGPTGRLPRLVFSPENKDQRLTEELAIGMATAEMPIVFAPMDMGTSTRTLEAPATFGAKGAKIAFGGGFPATPGCQMRMSASLAVRHGLDAAIARQAMTGHAAEVAGVADRVGSIVPGRVADLVVYSGDPLRLDSRILHVFVRGEEVHATSADPQPVQP